MGFKRESEIEGERGVRESKRARKWELMNRRMRSSMKLVEAPSHCILIYIFAI
jgi:hypothetical protein